MDMEMDEVLVSGRHGSLEGFYFPRDCNNFPLTDLRAGGLITVFPKRTSPTSMSIEIKIRKNEPIDRALRRMKKKLDRENIIKGIRAKRYYEKPCEKRRRKEKVQAFTAMLRRRYDS
jgi:small subunit ribosomal protein S21